METVAFEVTIVKCQKIRVILTARNIGRPREYIYFMGSEDAEVFANALENAVTGAHYSMIDHCPLCGDHIYRQSRLSQLRDGQIVHTKCFDAALRKEKIHRSDCQTYYFHFFPFDVPLYDYSNLMTGSRNCRLRYAIQAVSLDCIHLYLMESYACVKHHFCLTLKQCLDLVKEIRKTLKEFRQNEGSADEKNNRRTALEGNGYEQSQGYGYTHSVKLQHSRMTKLGTSAQMEEVRNGQYNQITGVSASPSRLADKHLLY